MTRRVLILAYKFPDVIVPGGSTRVEKFVKYLPRYGWEPLVLSVKVPPGTPLEPVHAAAQRTRSHYGAFVRAYRARYLAERPSRVVEAARRLKNLVLVPDDAVLWWPQALPAALRLVRQHRPAALFVSGPPYSGLLLGALVARITGVPFVADLRDDWAGNPLAGPRNLTQALTERRLERLALRRAASVLHVTQASLDLYRQRYPKVDMRLLPNGFDEEDFTDLAPPAKRAGELRLLHVGSLKGGRSPQPVFDAMKRLAERDPKYARISFVLVGTHHREHVDAAHASGLDAQVTWIEREPRRDVVRRMGECDALVLLPSQDAPTAIPGKTYEYLRAGRPVLVVSDPNETTRFLAGKGPVVKAPADAHGIADVLADWFDRTDPPVFPAADVARYARERLAGELAAVLEEALC